VHAYSDHTKAEQIFGHTATVSLEEGVERMAKWARRVGARRGQTFDDIEIVQNLPASWRA
jgi:UDP-glucose 4-epimerase